MLSSLEAALCRLHQRSYCVSVSSGTVGLALTMEALGLGGKGIATPAGVCLNVPLSVHYARAIPVYCDIDPGTLGLSQATLSNAMDSFAAVLAVHAYGNVCDIRAIEDHCRAMGMPLIEDVAVAQGAWSDDRPAGSFGIASILSFGSGKIIDVGGGGAVVTDDRALAKAVRQAYDRLPERTNADEQRINALSSWHTQLYNQYYGKNLDQHVAPFIDAALTLCDAALTRCDWNANRAAASLARLAENLDRRHALMDYLFGHVESRLDLRCHRPSRGGVPWRANLFVPGSRNFVLKTLLGEGVKISSWYPPAQDFLAPAWSGDTPVARRVGEEILNVWINDEVGTDYLDGVIERMASTATTGCD
jgi:dTDP-4-amino-4,6-dideoxygalactose transaminase